MTPSLFVSACTVVVENVPWFAPAERKVDLLDKCLSLWEEGQRDESGRVFMALLRSEGWTREQWLDASDPSELAGTLKDYRAHAREIQTVWQYCREQNLAPGNPRADEQGRILQLLEQGLPAGSRLLLLAPQVDKRGRGYKQLTRQGCVVDLSVERDRGGRIGRESLSSFLDQRLRRARKRIDPRAREALLSRCGNELWAVHQEIEKLLLYVGAAETVEDRRRGGDLHGPVGELGVRPDRFPRPKGRAPGPGLSPAPHGQRRVSATGPGRHRQPGAPSPERAPAPGPRTGAGSGAAACPMPSSSNGSLPDTEGLPTKSPYANYLTLQRAETVHPPRAAMTSCG